MDTESAPVLAGDIGGTKTRLALYRERDGRYECLLERAYASVITSYSIHYTKLYESSVREPATK